MYFNAKVIPLVNLLLAYSEKEIRIVSICHLDTTDKMN